MADPLDVEARLAEGRPAVGDLEEYVAACRRLGYQHRDLTMGPNQVRDWYGGEQGMDLRALDADHVALSAAAVAAEDAARSQADLVARLAAAWSGRGAAEAHEFVWRSGQAATEVSRAVRSAADAMAALRDALWRAVDAKVVATEAVDGRQRAQRVEWLAAARTVTTGAGDVAAASELIDQRVKPFVDVDVGSGWVAAMRTAAASIDAAYDAAAASTAMPAAVFGVPGDLGPSAVPADHPAAERDRWHAPDRSGPAVGGGSPVAAQPAAAASGWPSPAVTSPSSVPAPSAPAPFAPAEVAGPGQLADSAALPAGSSGAMPSLPSLGGLGAGSSGIGSGLSGFGQQLADLIGGLVGSAGGGLPDGPTDAGSDDPATDPTTDDAPKDDEATDDEAKDDPAKEEASDDPAKDAPAEEPKADAATAPPEPMPEPDPATVPPPVPEPPPMPAAPVPEAAAVAPRADGPPTPCEIAADQLPQVGE